MLKRFQILRQLLLNLDLDDVSEILPKPSPTIDIYTLYERLAEQEYVTKALQRDDTTLAEVRNYFDTILE